MRAQEVPREKGYDSCCDVVNRGVALWGDSVFVGAPKAKGMIGFDKFLGDADAEAIRAYVISEARKELGAGS